MTVFLGNFPVTRIDLLLSRNLGISPFKKYKYSPQNKDNFKGETYEGECSQVDEQKLLENNK